MFLDAESIAYDLKGQFSRSRSEHGKMLLFSLCHGHPNTHDDDGRLQKPVLY